MSSAAAAVPPPALTLVGIEVYTWIMTALTILISFGRYAIRWWYKRKLLWDDCTHFIALLALIGMNIAFQLLYPDAFFLTDVERGLGTPISPAAAIVMWTRDKRYQYALISMFLVSTWFVKFTFMLFYRELFKINANFMRAWWGVLVFVVLGWWVGFVLNVLTSCGDTADAYNFMVCNSPSTLAYGIRSTDVLCAMSVATDVAILVLPLWMLRTLKVRPAQKLGLALIFSIGIIIIALDIVRNVKSVAQTTDFTEVAAYDIAEACVAVIVSALPTYQALFRADRRPTRKATYYQDLNGNGGSGRSKGLGMSKGSSKGGSQVGGEGDLLGREDGMVKGGSQMRSVNVNVIAEGDEYRMESWGEAREREHV